HARIAVNHGARAKPQVAADHNGVALDASVHLHVAAYSHQIAVAASSDMNGTADADRVTQGLVGTDVNGFANVHHVVSVLGGNVGRVEARGNQQQPANNQQHAENFHGR